MSKYAFLPCLPYTLFLELVISFLSISDERFSVAILSITLNYNYPYILSFIPMCTEFICYSLRMNLNEIRKLHYTTMDVIQDDLNQIIKKRNTLIRGIRNRRSSEQLNQQIEIICNLNNFALDLYKCVFADVQFQVSDVIVNKLQSNLDFINAQYMTIMKKIMLIEEMQKEKS